MADDYCDTFITQSSSPLAAVINRYEEGGWRAANRYSNLFFAGVAESVFGSQSVKTVPVGMILLWGMGLVTLVRQVRKLAGIEWPILMDVFWEPWRRTSPFWRRPIVSKPFTGAPVW